jgi:zinc transporter ZupT
LKSATDFPKILFCSDFTMTYLFLRSTIATLIAFAGGGIGVLLGNGAARRLRLLVYAAMGALLAITAFDVLPDAKELLTWPEFLLASCSGYALFWVIGKYVYHLCPACSIGAFDQATTERLSRSVVLLTIALGLHSAMDGIAVVVGDRIAGHPNFALLFAISFHKLPEGLALALLLMGAGYGRRQAFWRTAAIESATEAGALLGLFGLRHASMLFLGLIFANVGGGFVYLIVSTLGVFTPSLGAGRTQKGATQFAVMGSVAFTLTAALIWTLRRWEP